MKLRINESNGNIYIPEDKEFPDGVYEAAEWFEENGYEGKLIKCNFSACWFDISKNGRKKKLRIPSGTNVIAYLNNIQELLP
jgi:hypothetical protein